MNHKPQSVSILDPVLGRITYPAIVLAASLYIWCAGDLRTALFASALGTAGAAWGWASGER